MKSNLKLNNIQMLRAFAAVSVVIYHTNIILPHMRYYFGGYGVDVFFVISGYIMARILDPASGSSSDFFLRRRILRIVPPYWFFTICLFCIAYVAPQFMVSTHANGVELLKSLFFIPFLKENGYIRPILFVGWSLNFEMLFYLALAIALLIWKRHAAWGGCVLILLIMVACKPFAAHSVVASFYSRLKVIEFVFGVVCYYLCNAIPNETARAFRVPLTLLCAACGIMLVLIQGFWTETFLNDTLSLGIFSFLLVGSACLLSQANWDIKISWIVLIGDASYILYLVHPYCELSIDRILGPRHPWLHTKSPAGALISVILSILVGILIHLYAERPTLRFLNRRFGGQRRSTEFVAQTVS